jgi:putative ATPase
MDGAVAVSLDDARAVSQKSAMRYDRDGDDHYDILSALQKSIRGSDPDAAVHYLGRLLEAGDLISPCHRLLVIASEDVGLAYPMAAAIVKACVDSAMQLGLPEAQIPLAEAAVLMATAPKSNSANTAIQRAMADLKAAERAASRGTCRMSTADSAGMEREQGYLYPHDFPNHWTRQQYLPDELRDAVYYEYADNKTSRRRSGTGSL